jgi:hypothetical protein
MVSHRVSHRVTSHEIPSDLWPQLVVSCAPASFFEGILPISKTNFLRGGAQNVFVALLVNFFALRFLHWYFGDPLRPSCICFADVRGWIDSFDWFVWWIPLVCLSVFVPWAVYSATVQYQ